MKSQKANTSLMLPATTHIQPKPTKTEIISAMVIRAKVKHDAENERRKAARPLIEKKINSLAAKLAKVKEPMKTAAPCAMCKENTEPEIYSTLFNSVVCRECAVCIKHGMRQLEIYGKKIGATTTIKFER